LSKQSRGQRFEMFVFVVEFDGQAEARAAIEFNQEFKK
jgi:hypothetical protein